MTAVPEVESRAPQPQERPARVGWALGAALVVSLALAGIAWVLASPLGSAPDDDYHLASIWCPQPIEDSCKVTVIDGVEAVEVPVAIGDYSPCYAFHPEWSAECTLGFSDDATRWAHRYDAGNYPGGFYRFHHLFVSDDPQSAALVMRVVNLVISMAVIGAVVALAPRRQRSAMTYALLASWVPMGIYFVASNNPTSWALTGTFAYATGVYASTRAQGGRRWVLLALGALGALLCFLSRFDAALYVFVGSVALAFAVRWTRRMWPQALVAAVLGLIGLAEMLVGSSGGAGPVDEAASAGPVREAVLAAMDLPNFLAGFYGVGFGPGWLDVPLDSAVTLPPLLVAGAVLVMGLRRGTWRSWMASLMVLGAMLGLPMVMAVTGVFPQLVGYQPRYILPLLPVLFFMLLTGSDDSEEGLVLTRPQAAFIGFSLVLANMMALRMVLLRYVHGVDAGFLLNLDFNREWWWDLPFGPMAVWITGSVAFLVAVGITVATLRDRRGPLVRAPGRRTRHGAAVVAGDDREEVLE